MSFTRVRGRVLDVPLLTLLLWTPNTVQRLFAPELPVNAYAYAAAGYLLGSLIRQFLSYGLQQRVDSLLRRINAFRVALAGLVWQVVLVVLYVMGGQRGFFAFWVACLAGTALCSLALSWVLQMTREQINGSDGNSASTNWPSRVSATLALALGLLTQPAWLAGVSAGGGPIILELTLSGVASCCVSLLFALLAADSAFEGTENGTEHLLVARLASLAACGTLSWNLYTRVANTSGLVSQSDSRAIIVALVSTTCLAAIRSHHGWCGSGVGETDSKPVDFAFPDLSEFGLTERETEAIGHLLRGRTSQESAELIGIKPSTVREYLRRAYRKIGVEGADQLRERYHLQLAVQGMSRGVEERGPDNSVGPVAEALLFATTLYLLLPVNAPHGVWGTGQDRLFALAAGMLASHTSVLCKRSDCRGPVRYSGNLLNRLPPIAAAMGSLVSDFIPHSASVMFACDAVLGFCLYRWWVAAASRRGAFKRRPIAMACPVVAFILCDLLLAELSLVVGVCLILATSFTMPLRDDTEETAVGVQPRESLCLFLIGCVVGGGLEEVWRGLYWFSFMPAALTFFTPVCFCCILSLFVRSSEQSVPSVAFSVSILTVAFVMPDLAPTILAALSLLLLVVSCGAYVAGPSGSPVLCGLSLGLVGGCVLFNRVATTFTYHVGVLGVYGTQTGFELVCVFLSALVFAASGIYVGRRIVCSGRFARDKLQQRSISLNEVVVRDVLAAYDLTPLQIDTALLLLQGRTVREISQELGYAPSTIKTARRVCLTRVQAPDIPSLRREILAGIRCSQGDS